MKITKEYIKTKFKEYNEMYFEKKLPIPSFSTFIGINNVGICFFNPNNQKQNKISIARNVNWNEENLKNVILHEMIHYYLGITEGKCDSKHKKSFNKMILFFKEKYNIVILKTYPHIEYTGKYKKILDDKHPIFNIFKKIKNFINDKYRSVLWKQQH